MPNDVAGMKAMLAGVFARAAEAKGRAGRRQETPAAGKPAPRSDDEPAVRLSLGAEPVEDALSGPAGAPPELAGRLDAAIRALARDLGRLLAAFGLESGGVAAAEQALVRRFGPPDLAHAVAALDGGRAEDEIDIALSGILLRVADGPPTVSVDEARLDLSRRPAEERGGAGGLSAVLGRLRDGGRSPAALTVAAGGLAGDALDGIMAALARAMAAEPAALEGRATLSPRTAAATAAAGGGGLELSLALAGPLDRLAAPAPSAAPAGKEIREQGFDVRI